MRILNGSSLLWDTLCIFWGPWFSLQALEVLRYYPSLPPVYSSVQKKPFKRANPNVVTQFTNMKNTSSVGSPSRPWYGHAALGHTSGHATYGYASHASGHATYGDAGHATLWCLERAVGLVENIASQNLMVYLSTCQRRELCQFFCSDECMYDKARRPIFWDFLGYPIFEAKGTAPNFDIKKWVTNKHCFIMGTWPGDDLLYFWLEHPWNSWKSPGCRTIQKPILLAR